MQQLKLEMIASHDTGKGFYRCSMVVLASSGDVVLSHDEDLVRYSLTENRFQRKPQLQQTCSHYGKYVLSVMVEGQELLAVSCGKCGYIKLVNMETGESSVAYQSQQGPRQMCEGDPGKLWVYLYKDHLVKELSCTNKVFSETGVAVPVESCSMCYLPAPHNALVVSPDEHRKPVKAFSREGELLWETLQQFDGKDIIPYGITFSSTHQLLLLADWGNSRILVLSPRDGSILKSFTLPEEVRHPRLMGWFGDQLILLSRKEEDNSYVLSCHNLIQG